MEEELMHELVAGYALDALTPEQEREFEEHLAHCADCQEELAAFTAAAAGLGLATPPATLPPGLHERLLETARRERGTVVPLRPRWAYPVAAAAAVAACAALGLGVWAESLHSRLGSAQALRALPLQGAAGSVVVGHGGSAALVVSGLHPAPAGKVYEVWVMRGASAEPAALFAPSAKTTTVVKLKRSIPAGARVGVTVEPAGGSPRPTTKPIVVSARA